MVKTTTQALASAAADIILRQFEAYDQNFSRITGHAKERFLKQQWQGLQRDTMRRYRLYEEALSECLRQLSTALHTASDDRELWQRIRQRYDHITAAHSDRPLALTFFNSVSRRQFRTQGVREDIEFHVDRIAPHLDGELDPFLHCYEMAQAPEAALTDILSQCELGPHLGDCQALASTLWPILAERWQHTETDPPLSRLEILPAVFYQHARAYLVGRATGGGQQMPVLFAMASTDQGVVFDALLTSPAETSMIFGFTRSYCMADLAEVTRSVVFLRRLMPHKPLSELYTVLGRVKQGKTERFRSFRQAMSSHQYTLRAAPGIRGMVMIVFWLPGLDLVFKVIRDRFDYPKSVRRVDVLDRYKLVFQHDRAGRLIDAQEYRSLVIPLARFDEAMRHELLNEAGRSVKRQGDNLLIRHCYTERRLTPLNLYLQDADEDQARAVVRDYGQAIRDLAISNIFPGDLLLKNFGVTRHQRVIFYDYDEICLLTECRFRRLPEAPDESLELFAEQSISVAENDIFPEQFPIFMGLNQQQLTWFREDHADLMRASWWKSTQERIQEQGDAGQIVPYQRAHALVETEAKKG